MHSSNGDPERSVSPLQGEDVIFELLEGESEAVTAGTDTSSTQDSGSCHDDNVYYDNFSAVYAAQLVCIHSLYDLCRAIKCLLKLMMIFTVLRLLVARIHMTSSIHHLQSVDNSDYSDNEYEPCVIAEVTCFTRRSDYSSRTARG